MENVKLCLDPVDMGRHFGILENRLTLWHHGGSTLLMEMTLPRMLYLPMPVAEKQVGTICTLWDLYKVVFWVYIKEDSPVMEEQCKSIWHGAMAASQASQGISDLCLSIAPANSLDVGFQQWEHHQLNASFEEVASVPTTPSVPSVTTSEFALEAMKQMAAGGTIN